MRVSDKDERKAWLAEQEQTTVKEACKRAATERLLIEVHVGRLAANGAGISEE